MSPDRSRAGARPLLIGRVYAHLLGAILVLVVFEVALFESGLADRVARVVSGVPWALVLGAFLILAWLASRMAYRLRTLPGQYAGLGLYILAKGLILVPLLFHAERAAPGVIEQAAQITVAGFLALTAIVYATRRDFSFLRPLLWWGGLLALTLILLALVSELRLGTWFNLAMVGLAGAAILYDTSKLPRRASDGRHVGAALSLLASVGMMFWHLARYLTRLRRHLR